MAPADSRPSRRAVLLGTASALALAACGGGGGEDDDSDGTGTGNNELTLIQFFGNDVLRAGIEQRATFGLADRDGVVSAEAPASIELRLSRNGEPVLGPVRLERHQEGLPRPYYPLLFSPPDPGIYEALASVDGASTPPVAFQVVSAAQVQVPQAGDPMPTLETPTFDDRRGVDPVCTDDPPCPLHDVTLAAALGEGRPVAFLVSTPRYCKVEICGPVLDVLLAEQASHSQVRMLHAEVYTDDSLATTTTAVKGLGLTFEPCLFLVGSSGRLALRLDTIYDGDELRAGLAALT